MKRKIIKIVVFYLAVIISLPVNAEKTYKKSNTNGNNTNPGNLGNAQRINAAGCVRARAFTELNMSNIRCRINQGGDMWWDFSTAYYEIPKGSGKHSMFAGALWIAGVDVNKNLKGSGNQFRQSGDDYWPGPVTTDGLASTDADVCKDYDRFWTLYRQDVYKLVAWQNDKENNPDYVMPDAIKNYPAHGDVSLRHPEFLAPFYDADGDFFYDPTKNDYPYYDLRNEFAEPGSSGPTMEGIVSGTGNGIMADQILKGDQTIWWVFNDKGNVHTESGGDPVGFEFRAQAFAFATSDEVNDMTFYSYEIINRGTFRLDSTYFCQWTDADLGKADDDYVGCDVQRGLAYCYNGNPSDGTGGVGQYGENPPAIGLDFFQGPYLDNNDTDDYFAFDPSQPDIVPESMDDPAWNTINGLNFGDGIPDNERFGMRSFLYYNNSGGNGMGDPDEFPEYYNYLRGMWEDGVTMKYGGNGRIASTGATNVACKFMFPGDSDPWLWGTNRIDPGYNNGTNNWTEQTGGNEPGDRRLLQSAGPFTLEPGAVNYITVGVPWARATSGGPWASVEKLRVVDDKCQMLFINNFRMIDGPDAPIVKIQEMNNELILYLTYPEGSNNYAAKYEEGDYSIVTPPDELPIRRDSIYRFEGYKIYQLHDRNTTIADIDNIDKARLIAQCDVKNGKGQLINYEFKADAGGEVPKIMVNGEDKGLRHSFRVFEDKFATGADKKLVNNKQYYFIAIAYGFNEYKKYIPNSNDNRDGQKRPYLQGRFNGDKAAIVPVSGTPHNPAVENGGTVLNASYGDQPIICRIEGQGNGGFVCDLEAVTENEILSGPPWRAQKLNYVKGKGPLNILVTDPLSAKDGNFIFKMVKIVNTPKQNYAYPMPDGALVDTAQWILINVDTKDTIWSHRNLSIQYEQLLPEYGLSLVISQIPPLAGSIDTRKNIVDDNAFIESSLTFSGSTTWLTGIYDSDRDAIYDWIKSGIGDLDYNNGSGNRRVYFDANQQFEKVVNGSWAPFLLCGTQSEQKHFPGITDNSTIKNLGFLHEIPSIDVVLTPDKSKWTRCPVIEMCHIRDLADKGLPEWGDNHPAVSRWPATNKKPTLYGLRWGQSIDKDGNAYPYADTIFSNDPNAANFIASTSMGWFPGYAINIETGERLNMAYSENSRFQQYNGRDMKYNPHHLLEKADSGYTATDLTDTIFGGMHYIYVFGHNTDGYGSPAYDYGRWLHDTLTYLKSTIPSNTLNRAVYKYVSWVGMMRAVENTNWLENEARIRIRVSKPYARYFSTPLNQMGANAQNADYPMYTINMSGMSVEFNNNQTAKDVMELIHVVPNPYYSYSDYEISQTDNRVRITNLPVKCTISIYNASGTLIRRFSRDDKAVTYQDWDLKNHAGIPISSGVYIFHIDAPGIGEKVVKWFGGMRPVDLNTF